MKLALATTILVVQATNGVLGQEGKKGRSPSESVDGKKGMSMMSIPAPPDRSAEFCFNTGLDVCENRNLCSEGISNDIIEPRETIESVAECETFCADNMVSDDYWIQYEFRNGGDLCQCFEECAVWGSGANREVNLLVVGDRECDTLEAGFYEGTNSTLCQPFSCTAIKKDVIRFTDIDNVNDCADRCASVRMSGSNPGVGRGIFALNSGSDSCFCLDECTQNGFNGGMTSVYSVDGLDPNCDMVPEPEYVHASDRRGSS